MAVYRHKKSRKLYEAGSTFVDGNNRPVAVWAYPMARTGAGREILLKNLDRVLFNPDTLQYEKVKNEA